jgi:hypothetical protein
MWIGTFVPGINLTSEATIISQAQNIFISHVHNPHDAIWRLHSFRASYYLTNDSDIEDCI